MKISGNDELNRYINSASSNKTLESCEQTRTQAEDALADTKNGTVVQLSPRAKEIQVAREALASEPDVRRDKVLEISDKVRKGTYDIDPDNIAEKMVSAFLDKMI
jgi:negative regulator of flagellin synthesis FlgM